MMEKLNIWEFVKLPNHMLCVLILDLFLKNLILFYYILLEVKNKYLYEKYAIKSGYKLSEYGLYDKNNTSISLNPKKLFLNFYNYLIYLLRKIKKNILFLYHVYLVYITYNIIHFYLIVIF